MENLNVDSKEGKNGNAEAKKEKDKEDGSQNPSAEGEVNFCLKKKNIFSFAFTQVYLTERLTWKANAVRKMTRRAVIPSAIITSSPS